MRSRRLSVVYGRRRGRWRFSNVVISTQHTADVEHKQIEEFCIEEVVKKGVAEGSAHGGHALSDQSHRPFRRRWTAGRHGTHGPQDHRGHLRWLWTARRVARFLGQGPEQKWIAARLTWAVTWRRTSWRRGLAKRAEIQFAYAIGYPEPVERVCKHVRHGCRRVTRRSLKRWCAVFSFKAGRHREAAQLAAPDLFEDDQLRSLRQGRQRFGPGKRPTRLPRSRRRSVNPQHFNNELTNLWPK